jgi:Flp pilus assembly protein TadD
MVGESSGAVPPRLADARMAARAASGPSGTPWRSGGEGKLDRSITILQGLVEIHPADAEAHNALGFALYLRGDREPAVQHFRRALQLDPRLQEAKENLEYALAQMKQ